MNQHQSLSAPTSRSAKFDLLRVRLEGEVELPAVIAISSATADDGRDIAARELAYSFAASGYATLFVDTVLARRGGSKPPVDHSLEEVARLVSAPDPRVRCVAVLTLNDPTLQKTTNQRGLQLAFESLRLKFDVVVVSTGCGSFAPFASAIVRVADAVLVTVRTGRHETAEDARLSADLELIGPRFLGVLAIQPAVIGDARFSIAGIAEAQRGRATHFERQVWMRGTGAGSRSH